MTATTIKEYPIDCTAKEVRGILDGTITQLRREMELPPANPKGNRGGLLYYDRQYNCVSDGVVRFLDWKCPFGQIGDCLYVRESVYIDDYEYDTDALPLEKPSDLDEQSIYYRADGECCEQIPECACTEYAEPTPWRPPQDMPRWLSRITLEIVDVKVERINRVRHWLLTFKRI